MSLFHIKENGSIEIIREDEFKLEKEIQKLTEDNLNSVFDLELVKSEFIINNFRIDTLAFSRKDNFFAVIEYKRDKNFSVVDQGYAYLSLMLNNKADFILEYNEQKKDKLKRDDIDWSQSKVIFVSPSFTTYQKEAINFKDLPIELWEVKRFSNKTVNYSKIQTAATNESIKTISKKNDTIDKVNKEIIVYTEQDHLKNTSENIKELYEQFKSGILSLDNFEIKPKKYYIAFAKESNIVDIHIQKNSLKMWINLSKGQLDDSKKITKDVSNIGHWGNGDYELQIKDDSELEYILSLVRQSLKINTK